MIKQNRYGEVLRTEYITGITEHQQRQQLTHDIGEANEVSTDYSGREILEFVQNMADAANKSSRDCCGLIKLVGSNIIICNQGTPFDADGILSIHQAYMSPKDDEDIGNKGLGFRGCLNIADSVEIYSGEFAIKFSKQIAEQELEKIKNDSQIQKTIKKYGEKTYIPMFATPVDVDFPENTTKDGKYKIDGVEYDTYIKLHLKDDDKTQKFIKQICDFINTDSNSLLFLNRLKSLTFVYPYDAQDVVKTICAKETKTISTQPNIKLYELYTSDSEKSESYYVCTKKDLIIAVPTEISDKKYVPYVYFPVKKEDDSFPVILHAKKFRISSNRNSFEDQSDTNIDIAKNLFDFLLEISCFFANKKYDTLSLKMVKFLTELSTPFKENENYFYEKLCACPIIPTMTSVYKSLNDGIQMYDNIFNEYTNLFKNNDNIISPDICDKISDALKPRVKTLSPEEMYEKINEISEELDSDTRAKLFYDWKKFTKDKCDSLMPKLLKYTNGDFFTYDTSEHGRISILATDKDIKNIPGWAKNPILCQEDREALYDNIAKLKPDYTSSDHKDREIENNYKEDFVYAEDINKFLENFMNKLIDDDYSRATDLVVFLIKNRDIADRLNKNETKLNFPDNNGNVLTADNLYFGASYDEHNENICNLFEKKEFISFDKIKPYIDSNITPQDVKDLFYKYYFVNKTPSKIIHDNLMITDAGYNGYLKDQLKEKEDITNFDNLSITQANMPFIKNLAIALNNVKTREDTECVLSWINNEESIRNHIAHNRELKVFFRYKFPRSYSAEISDNLYGDNYDKYLLYTKKWLVIDNDHKYAPRELLLKSDINGIIKSAVDIFGEGYRKLFSEIGVKENIYETDADVFYKALLSLPKVDKDGTISRRIYNNLSGEDKYKRYAPVSIIECPDKKRFFDEGKLFAKQFEKSKGEFRPVSEVKFASRKTLNLSNQWLLDKGSRTGNAKEFKSIFNIDEVKDKINITKTTIHPAQGSFEELWNDFKPFAEVYATTNTNIQRKLQNLKITIVSSAENDGKVIEKDIPDYFVLPGANDTEWYIYLSKDQDTLDSENLGANLGEIFNIIANSGRSVKSEIDLLFRSKDRYNKLEDFGCDTTSFKTPESWRDSFFEALKNCVPDFDYDSLSLDIFKNLGSSASQKQIIDILTANNLTFKDIKDKGFAYDMDFSTYHNSVIANMLSKVQYESQLYNDIKDKPDSEIKKQFFDTVENFERKRQNISVDESDIKCDYDAYCKKLNQYYGQKTISDSETNITDVFHKNRKKFTETYTNFSEDDLSNFSNEEKSMLLFELFDDLKASIENRINNKQQQDAARNQSNQQKSYKIVVDAEFVAKKPHQSSGEHTKHNSRKESGEKIAKEKAKKGEEAEEIVYNSIFGNKDYTEIDWVSAIGYKKGKGIGKDDSLGYDISYKFIPENKTYYAEVKSVSKRGKSYEFSVSSNEKAFAKAHPDSFVFALVLPNDEIRILKDANEIDEIFKNAATETYRCAVGLTDENE